MKAPLRLATAAAMLGLAACGTQQLDTADVEKTIAKRLGEQAGTLVLVDCPDDVEIKKGDTFNCRARARNDTAKVKVTQLDDEGKVRWAVQ